MRLTLRTLLAYLDDMLDDEDANTLKAKIDESGLAAELITRIQNSVDSRELGAISPDAIGPLENANVMSEYLDSTLSPEQIAEIERLCLESDTSLSEAAACHQILTVVLGQPAQVSDRLRQHIYTLPNSDQLRAMEHQSQPAADTASAKPAVATGPLTYSGIDIPPETNKNAGAPLASNYALANASAADLDRGAADFDRDAATAIRPVEPQDSGVAKASARLRKTATPDDEPERSEAEIVAGTTRAVMGGRDGYGGGIRPSRITSWLVALALAGVLLYALGQVFSPLTEQDISGGAVAQHDTPTTPKPVIDSAPETSPAESTVTDQPVDPNGPQATDPKLADEPVITEPEQDVIALVDALTNSPEMETAAPGPTEPATVPPVVLAPSVAQPSQNDPALPAPVADPPTTTPPTTTPPATVAPDRTAPATNTFPDAAVMAEADLDSETVDEIAEPDDPLETMITPEAPDADVAGELVAGEPDPQAPAPVVAEMTQAGSLVIVRQGDTWKRLTVRQPPAEPDDPESEQPSDPEPAQPAPVTPEPVQPTLTSDSVGAGQTIVAPALFRPTLVNPSGIEWTLAGPTRMRIGQNDAGGTVTQVLDGRILLSSTQPDVTTTLILGQRQIKIAMPEPQTVLAIELAHFRPLGADPLVPGNRLPEYRVISVQGTAMIQAVPVPGDPNPASSDTLTLESTQQYHGKGIQPGAILPVDRLPAWIDAGAKRDVLADSARDGLMEFTTRDEPIEKSLREAMTFRRVEVAALAAETLLLLGRADVYFGGDGILNRPRQRLYWEEHVDMLRQQIASDAPAAEAVRVAIERAELADSRRLFKLLVGFTQEELAAGADAELVALLDSPSMAVRVLAIENLREIVGDTLAYRADQENANTRKSDIKKWDTRLRRGDIRYQQ